MFLIDFMRQATKKQHPLLMVVFLFALSSLMAGCANEALHELGMNQIKNGDYDNGVLTLQKATDSDPENQRVRTDYLRERDRVLNRLFGDASRLIYAAEWDEAEKVYQRIIKIDPTNPKAVAGLSDVARGRKHAESIVNSNAALNESDFDKAKHVLQPTLVENPKNSEAQALVQKIDQEKSGTEPGVVPAIAAGYKKAVSLQFRDANLKMIFEAISKASGINILLDKDIKSDQKATIFVKEASIDDALNLLFMQNQLEKKVINENTIYVYPSTAPKLKDYQDLVIRIFQLSNADAKQMQSLLKSVLKVKEVFLNEKTNSLIIRDTPEVAELAAKLIASQDVSEPEVMLEVEVLEVSLTKLTQVGLRYPDQVTFTAGDLASSATSAAGMTLNKLKTLNSSNVLVSAAGGLNLVVDLKKQDGDTNILASPRIRVKQHEKAKIHIGDRVPIITTTANASSTGGTLLTGSVQYMDVGLKLEVEPDIHSDGEVGIKTSMEVSTISNTVTNSTNGTVAYQIGTRNTSTVLKLKDGETQVLAGLINQSELKGAVKVPFLGDIPVLGRLFSTNSQDKKKTEIVLAITPHIIRNVQQPSAELSMYWSGTDSVMRSKPITSEKMNVIKIEGNGTGAFTPPAKPAPTPVPPAQVPYSPMVNPNTPNVNPNNPPVSSSEPAKPATDGQAPALPAQPQADSTPKPLPQVPVPEAKPIQPQAPQPKVNSLVNPQNDMGSAGMSDAVLYAPNSR